MTKPISADLFDKLATPQPAPRFSLAADSLWGAQRIADFMGTSDDFVRKLAKEKSAPIRIRGGRYFSTKTEITAWLCP